MRSIESLNMELESLKRELENKVNRNTENKEINDFTINGSLILGTLGNILEILKLATGTNNGLMSKEDYEKLSKIEVVQTTGTSTEKVMSQNSVTNSLNTKVNKAGDTMTGTLNSSATTMMKSTITSMQLHSNSSLIGFLNSGGNWIFRSDNSGNTISTGNVTAYSDMKLKKDIEIIDNALEKIHKLNGYTFTRIDTGERQSGVIAQEVNNVLPEVITEHVIDNETVLSVAYGNIVGLLIEGIKEQQKQIEELKKVILNGSTV